MTNIELEVITNAIQRAISESEERSQARMLTVAQALAQSMVEALIANDAKQSKALARQFEELTPVIIEGTNQLVARGLQAHAQRTGAAS